MGSSKSFLAIITTSGIESKRMSSWEYLNLTVAAIQIATSISAKLENKEYKTTKII
jgi:hypothetical protein